MVTRLVRTLVLAVWEFKIDVYLYLMFQEARLRDYSDEKVCTDTCFIKVTNESINYQQQFFCIVFAAAAAVVFPLLRNTTVAPGICTNTQTEGVRNLRFRYSNLKTGVYICGKCL